MKLRHYPWDFRSWKFTFAAACALLFSQWMASAAGLSSGFDFGTPGRTRDWTNSTQAFSIAANHPSAIKTGKSFTLADTGRVVLKLSDFTPVGGSGLTWQGGTGTAFPGHDSHQLWLGDHFHLPLESIVWRILHSGCGHGGHPPIISP
jgi:hypothetical protein